MQEPGPTEPLLPSHDVSCSQEFGAMAAELVSQEPGPLQELGAIEPLLPWHAVSWSQEFGAMAAVLLAQASSPLQELPATGPVLLKQASMPMQFAGGRALPIPAEPTMTRIPQIAAATSHVPLFMLNPPGPCLSLPQTDVKQNIGLKWPILSLTCCKHILTIRLLG